MWTCVPTADLPGWVCRVPGCLSPSHSIILPPASVLGWVRAEVPTDHGSTTLPFPEWSSSLPGVGGLFCSLHTTLRVSYICYSCFIGVCVGECFHLAFLLYHLLSSLVFILYKDYTKQGYITFIQLFRSLKRSSWNSVLSEPIIIKLKILHDGTKKWNEPEERVRTWIN